jgi:branched-subunit amino acid transport protein
MSPTLTIVLMAVVTFLPRFIGFLLSGRKVSPFWLKFLHFVPISVFAALIAPSLPSTPSETPLRLVAALLAVVAIWRLKRLWIGIVVGMGAFWLLRYLF